MKGQRINDNWHRAEVQPSKQKHLSFRQEILPVTEANYNIHYKL